MSIFSQLATITATFDTFGVINEFILPPSSSYAFSRTLLATDDEDENSFSEERLYNDAMRSLKFVLIFTIFSVLFCSLSFHIYNRPFDGPNGSSFVSKIRKLPFFGWFFRQPQFAVEKQSQTHEKVGLMDDTDENLNENEKDIELGETDSKSSSAGVSNHKASKPIINNNGAGSGSPVGVSSDTSNNINTPTQYRAPLLFNSANMTLLICSIGLLIAYLTWGFMQERIMSHPYGDPENEENWFKSSEFCVLINRFFGLAVASVALRFSNRSGKDAPPFVLALCALSNMSSSWFQYESLHFVTFPVQTIFKSSKILITMGVGKIVQKKSFPMRKYLNALAVAVGVYIFLDGQQKESKKHGNDASDLGYYFYLGLIMISAYAFCDAFTSNWQSRVFEQTKISSLEMMQGVNAFTFVVSLAFCLGDLFNIIEFYFKHPAIIGHSLLMGLCAGFGQVLIFYTIQVFGAVIFATVMTTRMVISVLISIWWYEHPMSSQGIFGMIITFIALFYQVYDKSRKDGKGSNKK